ncbi:polysaccharide pyruvyl transferase family protein [Dyadobacter sp.]|uniref:polysaccharide pyruvyl transferase family protein n=1 Tax=Dyadobacter sp. TaxID=1914288 RepID=UPI003F729155
MGDLLINKCLIDEVAKYGTVYLDTKNVPSHFKDVLLEHSNTRELSEISNTSFKGQGALLFPLKRNLKFDHIFKSPGPSNGVRSLTGLLTSMVFYSIFSINKLRNGKSYLVGVDFQAKNRLDKIVQAMLSSALEKIMVRSKRNEQSLLSRGISNVRYYPDLCFLMKQRVSISINKRKIGVSFRDLTDPALNLDIADAARVLVNFYSSRGFEVHFFYQVDRDYAFTKSLFEMHDKNPSVFFKENVLKWEELDYYSDMRIVLSNRLHVLLLAQMHECIPIGLLKKNMKTDKIQNIYESIGLSHLMLTSLQSDFLLQQEENYDSEVTRIRSVNEEQNLLGQSVIKELLR